MLRMERASTFKLLRRLTVQEFHVGLWIKAATLQFSLYLIRFPMSNGLRHVVNPRRRGSWRCITRNHKRIRAAKDQTTLGACITDDLHS